ncbi:MAG TPA: LCP family protein [Anaerolineales bacterium]|nr:LCP family protein [Anaerolineales bacterium]
MNRIAWIVVGFLAAVIVLACLAGGYYLYNRSLGPGLQLAPAVVTQLVTVVVTPEPIVPPPSTEVPPPTLTPLIAPTETPIPIPTDVAAAVDCGGSGKMALLLLGESSLEKNPERGADAIRLVKVDFDNDAVTILSMPPDLWVNTPNLAGVTATTLTNSYRTAKDASASQGERTAMVQGTQATAQALLDNFGYQPDHYITLSQLLFTSMVDTLGGIEITVPTRVDGRAEGRGLFESGPQVFSGQRANDYVRILQPNNQLQPDEWGRFERQNQVISALRAEILRPENLPVMPQLISQFADLVVTNLSPNQLLDLNCMIAAVGGNINVQQVSQDMVTVDSQGHTIPDGAEIRSLIEVSLNQ